MAKPTKLARAKEFDSRLEGFPIKSIELQSDEDDGFDTPKVKTKKASKASKPAKSSFQEFSEDELVSQPTTQEFSEDELVDDSFLASTAGQFTAGAQDILDIPRGAIQSTLGSAEFSIEGGLRHIPSEEAVARAEAGEFDIPGAAKRDPQGILEKGARFAGQTAAIVPALGLAAAAVPTIAAGRLITLTSYPRKFVSEFGRSFLKDPSKTIGLETGFGFTAGLGGGVAQEFFPDSVAAKFIGEIFGGIAPQLMPFSIAASATRYLKRQFAKFEFFSKAPRKGMDRAAARVARAVPEASRAGVLSEFDLPTTIDNATGKPVLTPAQVSGAPQLMALEKSITTSTDELVEQAGAQITHANQVIQDSLSDITDAPISAVDDIIEKGHAYLDSLLDTRIKIAAQRTEERIVALGTSVTREQTNLIAREEIEKALVVAREQEEQLYSLVDPEIKAPFHNSLAELKKIRKETGKAQLEDIAPVASILNTLGPKKSRDVLEFDFENATPDELVQRLADEMQVVELVASEIQPVEQAADAIIDALVAGGASRAQAAQQVTQMLTEATERNTLRVLSETKQTAQGLAPVIVQPLTTIKELRAVQSKLREVARNARAGDKKNLNMARIADKIADKITDDIADNLAGDEVAEAVQTAVTFSRNKNERFGRGAAGKILGRESTGAPSVPEGLTFEQTIGVTGPRAREAMDDLIKIFDNPDVPGAKLVIGAAEDYLSSKFLKAAVFRGQLNIVSAQRFLKQNEEILTRLPNLRNQIDEVIESGEALVLTQRQRARIHLDDPKVSKATMFIQKGPVATFQQMQRLKPAVAEREMQLLLNRVDKDRTGEALDGLKSAFVEFLFAGARGKRDAQGLEFISGFSLRDTLSNPSTQVMAKKLFTIPEQQRLAVITQDFIRLEKARAAQPSKEGIVGDIPGQFLGIIARFAGAQFGGQLSKSTGGGGQLQAASLFSQRFREFVAARIQDPAAKLLRDSVQDEKLFREVLQAPLDAAGNPTPEALRRFDIWAFNTIKEYGGSFASGEEGDESAIQEFSEDELTESAL